MTAPAAPRLPNSIRDHLEHELYTYPATLRAIQERRRHLIDGGDGRDPVDTPLKRSAVAWSDPTHFAGTALATDALLREMERIAGAIQEVLGHPALPADLLELVERSYGLNGRRCESVAAIAEAMAMSRTDIYRKRGAVLTAIAMRLGWV